MSVRDTIRKTKPAISEFTLADGTRIWIRALSGSGRASYSAYVEKAKANGGIHAEVIAAMCICEEDGSLAYDWQKDADLAELLVLNGQDLEGISLRMFDVSGLTRKAADEAEKN